MAKKKKKSLWNLANNLEGDKVVWIIVILLILISVVCMFSSSSRLLSKDSTRIDIFKDQLKIVGFGLIVILICYNIKNIKFFRWCSQWGFLISFLLLSTLLIGSTLEIKTSWIEFPVINSAARIIELRGFQIHVSEIVKVAMVMYLSWAIDALGKGELKGPKNELWKKIIYLYAPFLTIFVMLIPGSNSCALLVGFVMFSVILLGGGNFKELSLLLLGGIVTIGLCFAIYKISDQKMMGRIGTAIGRIFEDDQSVQDFLDAPLYSDTYNKTLDLIRQPMGAKIAIKNGGFFGRGPGQSTQRYTVPNIYDDYMFSFIIEEYGIIGAILVICLYMSLLARASIIARNCGKDYFAKLSVAGLCLLISTQAFLHMFVNADIGPMTGQTLPLLSHGKSAFLCFSLAFGIILSFSRIAAKRIEKETLEASPLIEMHEDPKADLDTLDAFDSGELNNDLDILDDFSNE